MGIFDFLRSADINAGMAEYASDSGAVLVDVRTPGEYASGHIEGSRNIPLDTLASAQSAISDKSTPLYIYCHSGARSRYAARILRRLGYTAVKDIGGIMSYTGKVVV